MASTDTTLVIKNPSRSNQHFSLNFRLDGTIAELQQLLSETYEGRPAPADQTLIYGGKVLKDYTVRLREIVSKHDAPEGPHSIHLVIKHKPSTITASPARSVDSVATSASVSRASSSLNYAASGAARPVPPPTRTWPAPGSSPVAGAGPSDSGPSGSGPSASDRPAGDVAPEAGAAAFQNDSDDFGSASYWNAWGGYPGATAGLYGGAYGGYPFMRPFVPAAAGEDGGPAAAGHDAAASASAPQMPYTFYNPIIGGVYQAAYSAALAALSVAAQQEAGQQPQAAPEAHGGLSSAPAAEASGSEPSGTSAAAGAAHTAVPQYAYVPMFVPAYGQPGLPYGLPGQYPFTAPGGGPLSRRLQPGGSWPQNPLAQQWDQMNPAMGGGGGLVDLAALLDALDGGAGAAVRRQGGRAHPEGGGGGQAQGTGGPAAARDGQQALRQRRGRFLVAGPLAAALGNDPAGQGGRNRMGQVLAAAGARRPRVFTIRISARVLLQVLVFAVVLYQHFTWRRFLALVIGGAVLYITTTWSPFRRLMRGIHAMPPRGAPAAAPAGGAAAGGAPGPAVAAAGQAAGAAAGAPAARPARETQRRGILLEILVFIVGFITSLLPAWNFNPDDAAAFAAAQEMNAAEERIRLEQGGGAEGAAAPAEGGEARAAPGDGAGEDGPAVAAAVAAAAPDQ